MAGVLTLGKTDPGNQLQISRIARKPAQARLRAKIDCAADAIGNTFLNTITERQSNSDSLPVQSDSVQDSSKLQIRTNRVEDRFDLQIDNVP